MIQTLLSSAAPKCQSCFLLRRDETGGQKEIKSGERDMSRSKLFNFDIWGRGVSVQFFPQGFKYFVHIP